MTPIIQLYVTATDAAEARRLATSLLEGKLIACANIIPRVETLYREDGTTIETTEAVLLLKSTTAHQEALLEAIAANHSYSTPCILTHQPDLANATYHQWVDQQIGSTNP